jgi:hypothetical protein
LDKIIAPETSWSFITAWNPLPLVYGQDENHKRNADLQNRIQELGFNYFNALGRTMDKSWHEDSFLIAGISLETSKQLALYFGQLAFIYGEKGQPAQLIYPKLD